MYGNYHKDIDFVFLGGDELHSASDAFQPKFSCGFRQVTLERFGENQPYFQKIKIYSDYKYMC